MAPVDVLIPWAGHDPNRRLALEAVQDELRASFPDWRRILCRDHGPGWSKGRAIAGARMLLDDTSVVVVHDADVIVEREELERAVELVAGGAYGWAVPHVELVRLTRAGTHRFVHGLEADRLELSDVEESYTGVMGGGVVVLSAELLRRCPLDPRFTGWGEEDHAWGVALHTLGGRAWRGTGTLVHLWHPPQERPDRKRGSTASRALRRRYVLARRDPAVMRALIEEASP